MTLRARALAGALCAGVVLTGCGSDAKPSVETATVGRADVTEVVEAPASVAAKATVPVSAPASGTVSKLKVKDGQQVKAGQVLLRIDSPQARAQLDSARKANGQAASSRVPAAPGIDTSGSRQLDSAAREAFANARETAGKLPDATAREQALAQVKASEQRYLAASRATQQSVRSFNSQVGGLSSSLSSLSRAQRSQTRSAVALAEGLVDALVVRAPISGVVSFGSAGAGTPGLPGGLPSLPEGSGGAGGSAAQLLGGAPGGGAALAEGTPVIAGSTLLTVVDTSELGLRAEVDETDVLLVKRGLPADVELDAVPGATYPATVAGVDTVPTTSSRGGVTYTVRLSLGAGRTEDGSPAPAPKPGMSAIADLQVRSAPGAVAVPISSIFRDGKRDAVWVVTDGRARKRQVQLGAQGEDRAQVLEGLREGDRIVVRGADTVSEDAQLS